MDKSIGIIGHVDHEKTTLTAAMIRALLSMEQKAIVIVDEEKERERGFRPALKEIEPFVIINPYLFEPVYFEHDSNRNRKRKEERSKQKIKNKYRGKRNVFKK